MEGLVIFGVFVAVIVGLMYKARNKAGPGDASDIAAQPDIPRRPTSVLPQGSRPGYDPIDDKIGDAGVRPRP